MQKTAKNRNQKKHKKTLVKKVTFPGWPGYVGQYQKPKMPPIFWHTDNSYSKLLAKIYTQKQKYFNFKQTQKNASSVFFALPCS